MTGEKWIHPSFGCPECLAIYGWNLIGACASVGIERGKSTAQVASEFMSAYHQQHQNSPADDVELVDEVAEGGQ